MPTCMQLRVNMHVNTCQHAYEYMSTCLWIHVNMYASTC